MKDQKQQQPKDSKQRLVDKMSEEQKRKLKDSAFNKSGKIIRK